MLQFPVMSIPEASVESSAIRQADGPLLSYLALATPATVLRLCPRKPPKARSSVSDTLT